MDKQKQEAGGPGPDPVTRAQRAQPAGTATGAIIRVLEASVADSVVGPGKVEIGGIAGDVAGAVVGGLAGNSVADTIQPCAADPYWDNYWRKAYRNEPYYTRGRSFEDYAFAYRIGYCERLRKPDRAWHQAEPELRTEWERQDDASTSVQWDDAVLAVHAAWKRVGFQLSETIRTGDPAH